MCGHLLKWHTFYVERPMSSRAQNICPCQNVYLFVCKCSLILKSVKFITFHSNSFGIGNLRDATFYKNFEIPAQCGQRIKCNLVKMCTNASHEKYVYSYGTPTLESFTLYKPNRKFHFWFGFFFMCLVLLNV